MKQLPADILKPISNFDYPNLKKSTFNKANIRPNGIYRMGAAGIQQKSELQNFHNYFLT